MAVTYRERINAYAAYVGNNKSFVYSVNKHGPMAKELAELSDQDKQRHQHIFEEKEDYYVMKVYHAPTDTVYDVLIDKDDKEKLEPYKWYINVPQNARTLYVANDKLGKLHRYLIEVDDDYVVDHINRNGLDNRKENLRAVTCSENARNMDTKACNKLGQNGVAYYPAEGKHSARYRVHWQDDQKKFHTKSFSIAKYPDAFELAVAFRKEMEQRYNYIA